MFKGNTIASVCAIEVPAGAGSRVELKVVVETSGQDPELEQDRLMPVQAQAPTYQQQQQQRPLGFMQTDPSMDPTPLGGLQGSIAADLQQGTDTSHSGGEAQLKEAAPASDIQQQAPLDVAPPTKAEVPAPEDAPPATTESLPTKEAPPSTQPPITTIGAYRVFGCDGEVSDDVLLAALKAAYRDGVDIVNLSLGGSSGWPEEPFATACSAYTQKSLHIAIANGNDGEEGLFEDGAPATAAGAVSVGSV
ncbi:hypothetical protein BGW39_011421 [Mortierella sp. 14UC]|nr:hypothetical protein BGW39_011421 [Mortierella sp. 14UC]